MFNALTWIFLAALVAVTATRLWLAQRQIRHVRAHRDDPKHAASAAFRGTDAKEFPIL